MQSTWPARREFRRSSGQYCGSQWLSVFLSLPCVATLRVARTYFPRSPTCRLKEPRRYGPLTRCRQPRTRFGRIRLRDMINALSRSEFPNMKGDAMEFFGKAFFLSVILAV